MQIKESSLYFFKQLCGCVIHRQVLVASNYSSSPFDLRIFSIEIALEIDADIFSDISFQSPLFIPSNDLGSIQIIFYCREIDLQ